MAPNFLQKFVKSSSSNNAARERERERLSSEVSPRPSGFNINIPRNRSQSTSINSSTSGSNAAISPTTPTQASTLNSKKQIPSIVTTLTSNGSTGHVAGGRRASLSSIDTVSTQPNVTIVPPSPLSQNADLEPDDDEPSPPVIVGHQPGTNGATTATSEEPEGTVTPTPTPTLPNTQIPTPSSDNNMATTLAPGAYQVRKQSSNRSINSKKAPPAEISTDSGNGHVKAATAPAEVSSSTPENGTLTMKPMVESPTDLKFPSNVEKSPQQPNGSPANLTIQRENTVSSHKEGKRPWRRSTTRKPTGLASAIAGAGMTMANPSLTPAQQAQIQPPPLPLSAGSSKSSNAPPGSPPYLSRSPAQSSVSQKSAGRGHEKARSADLSSPRSTKSRKSSDGAASASGGGRTRRMSAAMSARSDVGSEYYGTSPSVVGMSNGVGGGDEIRPDYYSGLDLEDDSSDEGGSESDDEDDMDIDEEDIPVTGFAVASNKRNADFHELFPTVPEGDYLIEDYGCALQREILIQGRLYISENHICFHANIFGWITDLSIPIYEIISLEKKMTAFVIPNAIQITTRQAKYTFASFLSRDTTFDVIYNIWRLARPEDSASFMSSPRGSLDGPVIASGAVVGAPGEIGGVGGGLVAVTAVGGGAVAPVRRAMQCACGRDNKHYTETAMDVVIPGTPEKIHNLMFASGFIKEFMAVNQKLLDIQMADWRPVSPESKLLTRNMSYIKPLSGSLGPKQTKCEIRDEVVHSDFEEYMSTVTTTRTPDVPSGGVFSVKTRTCITWANPVSSRVVVTTQVEWTGRSFIKGIIERSAIDGQKVYHSDLEKAMRAYIHEHQSEFLPEGVDVTAVALIEVPETPEEAEGAKGEKHPTQEELKRRERERNARGLQWAWDTFDGAYQVAIRSTKGALELIRDAWDQSTSTTILWFVIVILVISNMWTLMRMGSGRDEASRKLEARKVEDREKWVQSIVTALWDELAAGKEAPVLADGVLHHGHGQPPSATPTSTIIVSPSPEIPVTTQEVVAPTSASPILEPSSKGWKEEVQRLHETLDVVEQRAKAIRESLAGFEQLNALD